MYYPIYMESIKDPFHFLETDLLPEELTPMDQLYSEATFANGKASIKPIEEKFATMKSELEEALKDQDKFDPKKFWKNTKWKDLEDSIQKIFNFRNVSINPFIEKYISKDQQFETKVLNCIVYSVDRFPIDGLVTDKGFYDSTKSSMLEIWLSLGLLRALEPDELTAVFLHEFGHGVDPALVDIRYAETNALVEYLIDRKKPEKKGEKKAISNKDGKVSFLTIIQHLSGENNKFANTINAALQKAEAKAKSFDWPWDNEKTRMEKIKKALAKDNSQFKRQEYSEAYADNFARMYGYGPQLAAAFKKMDANMMKAIERRHKHEKARQKAVVELTIASLKDEHKTSIHRIIAIKKEIESDIKDPNTPDIVKKQLQEDLESINKILNAYQNDFSDFQNNCYKMLIDELGGTNKNINESSNKDKTNWHMWNGSMAGSVIGASVAGVPGALIGGAAGAYAGETMRKVNKFIDEKDEEKKSKKNKEDTTNEDDNKEEKKDKKKNKE